jgi:hypothetical protein
MYKNLSCNTGCRSFDFEVETKSGVVHTFSSIEKDEYGKLFDFITSKKLRVKNRGKSVSCHILRCLIYPLMALLSQFIQYLSLPVSFF